MTKQLLLESCEIDLISQIDLRLELEKAVRRVSCWPRPGWHVTAMTNVGRKGPRLFLVLFRLFYPTGEWRWIYEWRSRQARLGRRLPGAYYGLYCMSSRRGHSKSNIQWKYSTIINIFFLHFLFILLFFNFSHRYSIFQMIKTRFRPDSILSRLFLALWPAQTLRSLGASRSRKQTEVQGGGTLRQRKW